MRNRITFLDRRRLERVAPAHATAGRMSVMTERDEPPLRAIGTLEVPRELVAEYPPPLRQEATMSFHDSAAWSGIEFVAQLQVACGAMAQGQTSTALQTVRAALISMDWAGLPPSHFVMARGVLLSFLVTVGTRCPAACSPRYMSALHNVSSAAPGALVPSAMAVLDSLEGPPRVETVAPEPRVQEALKMLHGERHRRVRVGEIACAVGLSRWHLERLTKSTTGASLRSHLRNARVEEAATLLMTHRFSVKEVSARVGYGNPDSFARDFKRHFGTTPHLWMRAQPRETAAAT